MKHLIFKNAIDAEFGYEQEKAIISLDDLGIINPKDQFKAISQGPGVVDYHFSMPQVYSNIKSQALDHDGQNDLKIVGVGIKARFDLNNIPFEKGEEPILPTFNELLKEVYVDAITANPGGDGPRGTSRNVIEMPTPQVKDGISGRIFTGRWIINFSNQGLDNISVLSDIEGWKLTTSDCGAPAEQPS